MTKQWVDYTLFNGFKNDYFSFFSQAIACYTPKFLWDAFEGGLLQMIVRGLSLGICREEEKQAKKSLILNYLTSHLKVIYRLPSRSWLYKYLFGHHRFGHLPINLISFEES